METLLLVAERDGPEMLARIADDEGAEPACEANVGTVQAACESLQDRQMRTVWVYVDTSKQVGDRDDLKVFANRDADAWFGKAWRLNMSTSYYQVLAGQRCENPTRAGITTAIAITAAIGADASGRAYPDSIAVNQEKPRNAGNSVAIGLCCRRSRRTGDRPRSRHVEQVFNPHRKDTHWGKRKPCA